MKSLLIGITTLVMIGGVQAETMRYESMTYSQAIRFQYDGRGKSVRAGQMNIRVDGEQFKAYCVDIDHTIRGGVNYNVTPTDVPVDETWCTVSALLDYVPNNSLDSAALQLAVWWTVYGDRIEAPTANVAALAQEYLAEVEGLCPLLCEEALVWQLTSSVNELGEVVLDVTLSRESGPAVVGQELFIEDGDGVLLLDGGLFTDTAGHASVTLAVEDLTLPLSLELNVEGTRVVTFDADPWTFQRLVAAYDTCEYSFEGEVSEDPFADPRTIGFWKHQVRGKGHSHVSFDVLNSWLPLTVFGTTFESVDELYDALWLKKAPMEARALQQCLATRLNVAYDQLGWATPVDLGDGDAYMFAHWAEANEAFNAGSFEAAKTLCDTINNL